MWMHYGVRKNPIAFGGGQRSFGVTRGQNLKILLTQYLKVGNFGKFHTKYVNASWCEEKLYCWSKVSWGRQGSNSGNLVYKIMSI